MIPPIHQTSTFVQPAPGEFVEDYDYSRSANPTRAALERALGELEGGHGAAFASGMAADARAAHRGADAGDHLILPIDLYGGTYRLVDKVLARFGLAYDLVDQTDIDALHAAIRAGDAPDLGRDADQPAAQRRRHRGGRRGGRGARSSWSTTPSPPPSCSGRSSSAPTAVVHSTTKYLGGHSDVVGGATVCADADLHERVRFVQNSVGAVPGPFDCFLVHRGIRTLALRVARHTENGAGGERLAARGARGRGRPLARLLRDGLLPPPRRDSRSPRGRGSSRSPSRSAAWSR